MHSTVELLAQSPCAKVTRCEGGHFHLTVGPVTVCMEPDVFRAVALTMRDAAARLEASQAPQVRA
ncbi:MAG: hypothetical protein DI536_22520 [Archangium gephyra]|uniref:Uncharacterized protein n=1 Tax=Archangium gephyra TaxID=48 RepID=A0A2W5UJX9_9BACT|nr:MAG: hypothetical protein DI536_22520 [Archangium gephyra]